MFGVFAIVYGLDCRDPSFASEPIKVFNVAVYLDREPPCAPANPKPIQVTVSPFKEQVYLGDLVAELARKAAEEGAKLVYAIKLTSFIPNQGAVATAMISSCLEPGFLPFNSNLISLLTRAPDVRAYDFANNAPDALRSVANSTLLPHSFKNSDKIAQLRQMILLRDSYDLTPGLRKSCPFFPSFGFEFREGNNSAWWLVSTPCETATLVSRDDDWRRSDNINLRNGSVASFRALLDGGDPKN
jgi:hypothetical protein